MNEFKESYKHFALNSNIGGKARREQEEKITMLKNALKQAEG